MRRYPLAGEVRLIPRVLVAQLRLSSGTGDRHHRIAILGREVKAVDDEVARFYAFHLCLEDAEPTEQANVWR